MKSILFSSFLAVVLGLTLSVLGYPIDAADVFAIVIAALVAGGGIAGYEPRAPLETPAELLRFPTTPRMRRTAQFSSDRKSA